jgi:hypothetical protein
MSQVSELSRLETVTSFGNVPVTPGVAVNNVRVAGKTWRVIGWRFAIGIVVIAIWLAATVNATGAAIMFSGNAAAAASQRSDTSLN